MTASEAAAALDALNKRLSQLLESPDPLPKQLGLVGALSDLSQVRDLIDVLIRLNEAVTGGSQLHDELEQQRADLDSLITQVATTRAELDELGDVAARHSRLLAEQSGLATRLSRLKAIDLAGAEAAVSGLTLQIQSLESALLPLTLDDFGALDERLRSEATVLAERSAENTALVDASAQAAVQAALDRHAALTVQVAAARKSIAKLDRKTHKLEADLQHVSSDLENRTLAHDQRMAAFSEQQAKLQRRLDEDRRIFEALDLSETDPSSALAARATAIMSDLEQALGQTIRDQQSRYEQTHELVAPSEVAQVEPPADAASDPE